MRSGRERVGHGSAQRSDERVSAAWLLQGMRRAGRGLSRGTLAAGAWRRRRALLHLQVLDLGRHLLLHGLALVALLEQRLVVLVNELQLARLGVLLEVFEGLWKQGGNASRQR